MERSPGLNKSREMGISIEILGLILLSICYKVRTQPHTLQSQSEATPAALPSWP